VKNIKKIADREFLTNISKRKDLMFAIVEKRKKGEITILVDHEKAQFMPEYPHLYYFEKLLP